VKESSIATNTQIIRNPTREEVVDEEALSFVSHFGAQTASRFNATTDNLFHTPHPASLITASRPAERPEDEIFHQWQLQNTRRMVSLEDSVASLIEKVASQQFEIVHLKQEVFEIRNERPLRPLKLKGVSLKRELDGRDKHLLQEQEIPDKRQSPAKELVGRDDQCYPPPREQEMLRRRSPPRDSFEQENPNDPQLQDLLETQRPHPRELFEQAKPNDPQLQELLETQQPRPRELFEHEKPNDPQLQELLETQQPHPPQVMDQQTRQHSTPHYIDQERRMSAPSNLQRHGTPPLQPKEQESQFMDQYARKSMTLSFKPSVFSPVEEASQGLDRYGEFEESAMNGEMDSIIAEQHTNNSNAQEASDDDDSDSQPLFAATQKRHVFSHT
jgi:hypothetical protein